MTVSVYGGIERPPVLAQCKDRLTQPKPFDWRDETFPEPCFKVSAALISRCLWGLFPGKTEWGVCCAAAPYLNTSPETVKRMMRGTTDGKWFWVWPILTAGVQRGLITADEIFGGQQ